MESDEIETLTAKDITEKSLAIVRFGPDTNSSGFTPAQYYQAVVDPEMISPSGDYIRFGYNKLDELNGWQKADCIFIVEILENLGD